MTLKINRVPDSPKDYVCTKVGQNPLMDLILECSQGCYVVKIWPGDLDLWPWKSIGFQTLVKTKNIPSLVKINWRMLILECSQGCYMVKIWTCDLDRWPWKSIGFQILLRTKYVPSLVKIHFRMLILECSQRLWRTDGSVTISLRNFVGEGIIKQQWTIEEISIFSNSSHLEWRSGLSDTIMKGTHPRIIPARFGVIWFRGFRGEI